MTFLHGVAVQRTWHAIAVIIGESLLDFSNKHIIALPRGIATLVVLNSKLPKTRIRCKLSLRNSPI